MPELNPFDIMSKALYTVILASAPPLICGLVIGILASIFQTVTSIQEPTLAFIPKIIAVMVALVVFGSFIASVLMQFTVEVFDNLPYLMQ